MRARPSIEFAKSYIGDAIDTIVEVGVQGGGNASAMSEVLRPKMFYLVDAYHTVIDGNEVFTKDEANRWFKEACLNIWNIPNCQFILKNSREASLYVPNNLDLVYIDATHTQLSLMIDIACWYPKIRMGGIICGHDYKKDLPPNQVRAIVDFLFKDKVQTGDVDWWIVKEKENYV